MKKLMLGWLLTAFAMAACSGESGSSSSSSSSGGGATCDVMAGTYHTGSSAANDCFGMAMTIHAAFNSATCTVTFTQPSRGGNNPGSATVAGAQVTFHGGTGNSWEGCTATLTDNMTMSNGSCTGAQTCTFSMHM